MSKTEKEKWGLNFNFSTGRVAVTGVLPDSVASQYSELEGFPLPVVAVNGVDVANMSKKEFADVIRAATTTMQIELEREPPADTANDAPSNDHKGPTIEPSIYDEPEVSTPAAASAAVITAAEEDQERVNTFTVSMRKDEDQKWGLNFNFSGGRVTVTGVVSGSVASQYPALANFPLPVVAVNNVNVVSMSKTGFANVIRAATTTMEIELEGEGPTDAAATLNDEGPSIEPSIYDEPEPSTTVAASDGAAEEEEERVSTFTVMMSKDADQKWGLNFNFSGGRVAITGVIPNSVAAE